MMNACNHRIEIFPLLHLNGEITIAMVDVLDTSLGSPPFSCAHLLQTPRLNNGKVTTLFRKKLPWYGVLLSSSGV